VGSHPGELQTRSGEKEDQDNWGGYGNRRFLKRKRKISRWGKKKNSNGEEDPKLQR